MRFARWSEVNFERSEVDNTGIRKPIPGVKHSERGMKMKTEHIVPLSKQAFDILNVYMPLSGKGEVIFPSDHDPKK